MKLRLKMLGDLRQYLPAGGQFNRCVLDLEGQPSVASVLARLALPADKEYLVILNGDLLPTGQYENTSLAESDELTLFPPIKGG